MSNKKNSLNGFENIEDLITEDSRHLRTRNEDLYKVHELLQFLGQEENRLKKLDSFFTRKYDNLIQTPQSAEIYDNLSHIVEDKKATLIDKLIPINSAVNQEMTQMWKSMFQMS
ncbi:MAG: hypothetical protein KAG61_09950 [Bacteriovoracaceae bacterium]|nr:hypothetical protein [Bacteriovoracaceae bacterium]